jgi:hypothetical protein
MPRKASPGAAVCLLAKVTQITPICDALTVRAEPVPGAQIGGDARGCEDLG